MVVLRLRRWWVWESLLGDDTDKCEEGFTKADTLQDLLGCNVS